jgi:hypothetical protein
MLHLSTNAELLKSRALAQSATLIHPHASIRSNCDSKPANEEIVELGAKTNRGIRNFVGFALHAEQPFHVRWSRFIRER